MLICFLIFFVYFDTAPGPSTDMATMPNSSTTLPPAPPGHTGKIVGLVFALAYILALIIVGLTFILIR